MGTPAEQRVARLGVSLGYLVSSRRHQGGAGDLLWTPTVPAAMDATRSGQPLLIEVKATGDLPWRSKFGPDAREAMLAAGVRYGVEPILAWLPPGIGDGIVWLPPEDWPD